MWSQEAGLDKDGPFRTKLIAQGPTRAGPTREQRVKNSAPNLLFLPLILPSSHSKRINGAQPNKSLPSTANFSGRRSSEEQGICSEKSRPVVTCRKQDLHPQFHEDAKVYCNGELVMTTGGTQKEYSVDVWSGNHPFYLGSHSALLVDADQVEKFRKKFGELTQLMEIPVLKGEIVLPTKRKSGDKGKKK